MHKSAITVTNHNRSVISNRITVPSLRAPAPSVFVRPVRLRPALPPASFPLRTAYTSGACDTDTHRTPDTMIDDTGVEEAERKKEKKKMKKKKKITERCWNLSITLLIITDYT